MKRRELFGIASAFPIAIAAGASAAAAARADISAISDQLYHVVFFFDKGVQDFRLAGIYTLEADAQAQADRLRKLDAKDICSIGVALANDGWLENFFVSVRLGDLKDALERLEKLVAGTGMTLNEVRVREGLEKI